MCAARCSTIQLTSSVWVMKRLRVLIWLYGDLKRWVFITFRIGNEREKKALKKRESLAIGLTAHTTQPTQLTRARRCYPFHNDIFRQFTHFQRFDGSSVLWANRKTPFISCNCAHSDCIIGFLPAREPSCSVCALILASSRLGEKKEVKYRSNEEEGVELKCL